MIIEFYPNPNKPVAPPPVVYTGGTSNGFLEYQATNRGISVEEFVRRDEAVRKESLKAQYAVGEMMFPFSKSEYERLGKCRILAIHRRYVDLGKDYKWEDDRPLFIVSASAEKTNYSTFLATAGFFKRTEPTE